jgi:electron transfer flavoprotein beta subunit
MQIVVCVKQVPDPSSPGRLDGSSHLLVRDGVEAVLDPGDQVGIEAGLRLTEAHGGDVTIVSMGPERALDAVRKALAMGAARGVLVTDDALQGSDALSTAKVLAAAIGRQPFDLVIAATESTDGYTGVVPQMIAELLGVPAVTFAKTVESDGAVLTVRRQTEVGFEVVEAAFPAVLSVTAAANEPRYPSLKGIMGARSKPIDRLSLADLGLTGVGGGSSGQTMTAVVAAAERPPGEIVQAGNDTAKRIVDYLARLKVI